MWPFSSKKFLGIDVGTAAVRLVQLSKNGKRINLDTYGEFNARHYFEQGRETSPSTSSSKLTDQQIADIIKTLTKAAGATSKYATLSLPSLSTFTTVITVPKMSPKELAHAVPFEAKQYVPLPISEVILDWHIINTKHISAPSAAGSAPHDIEQYEIFVAAFPKELIDKYARITRLAGLDLRALELETFSLVRAAVDRRYPTPVALIDLGANASNISIVKNGFVHATHNFDISGATLTNALAASLQIDLKRAEELKSRQGLLGQSGEEEISKILTPLVDLIMNESERIMATYTRKTNEKITKIVLSGGSANLPGIVERFVGRFGIETSLINPFETMTYPATLMRTLKEIGPHFAVATGLAMRELIQD